VKSSFLSVIALLAIAFASLTWQPPGKSESPAGAAYDVRTLAPAPVFLLVVCAEAKAVQPQLDIGSAHA